MKIKETPEQLKAELEQKQAAQLRELEFRNKILAMLPDEFERFTVYVHSTSYKADYYLKVEGKSYPPDSYPSLDQIRQLAALFPPEPMKLYTGTYKSFFAVGQFERNRAKKPEQTDRDYNAEQDICPWVVTVAPASYSQSVEIEWYTVIDGQRLEVTAKLPLWSQRWLGRSEVRYKEHMGGRTCETNNFHLNNEACYTLFDENETPVGQFAHKLRHWSTPENAGEHEICWEPISEKPVGLEALFRAMEWKPKPATV